MSKAWSRKVSLLPIGRHEARKRHTTYPLANSSRKKERRSVGYHTRKFDKSDSITSWPLVLRFWKGSIHGLIIFPVFVHAILAAFVVYINEHINSDFNLPSSIIPSLSIVVGLMLVFRNQTAYSRFWGGRLHINKVTTAVRCLSRQILVLVPAPSVYNGPPRDNYLDTPGTATPRRSQQLSSSTSDLEPFLSKSDELRTIETVKILMAMLYTIKNHLRAEWGVALSPGTSLTEDGQEATTEEYKELLPPGLRGYEHKGLGLTLQLSVFIEDFIRLGVQKKWIHNAASSSMLGELNAMISSYGGMEVIRLVPIPVAHLIHHKQTLALFCGILPFAMAADMSWWAVPLTGFVAFTLYGIEGIAQTYEDPFGVEKIDINMDDIVADARREVEVMLNAWQTQGNRGGMFRPPADGLSSSASSIYQSEDSTPADHSMLRVVVSDLNHEIERDLEERRKQQATGVSSKPASGLRSEYLLATEEDPLLGERDPRKESGVSPGTVLGQDYMSLTTPSNPGKLDENRRGKVSWSDADSTRLTE